MALATHPTRDDLRHYALGKLPDADYEEIAVHVETCHDCAAALESLDGTADTLVSNLLGAQADSTAPDTELRRAMAFVKAVGRDASRAAGQIEPDVLAGEDEGSPAPLGRLREYELLEKLGEGGMGAVYRARHTKLD